MFSEKELIENEKKKISTYTKKNGLLAFLILERQRRAVNLSQTIHSKQINKASNIKSCAKPTFYVIYNNLSVKASTISTTNTYILAQA